MTNAPHWTHTIRLEASPRSARQARDFVLQHLVNHRLLSLADPVERAERPTDHGLHVPHQGRAIARRGDEPAAVRGKHQICDSLPRMMPGNAGELPPGASVQQIDLPVVGVMTRRDQRTIR